jgi:hypothetical protein
MQCGTVRRLLKRKDKTGKRRATPEHGGMVGQLPLEQHIGVRILAVSVKGRGGPPADRSKDLLHQI